MACHHLLSIFVLSTLLFMFISPSDSFTKDDVTKAPSSVNSQKVNLSLYYESLCPFCANFITNELVKVFKTDLITIVNLRLVPWGNAEIIGPNKTIACQHGEDECYLNIIHACAIKAWPQVEKHFKFIHCIEGQAPLMEDKEAAWRKCCDTEGLSREPINHCYESGEGTKLVLKYGDETDHLHPPHRFVPWVTVNDNALQEDFQNFIAHVCKAYKGKILPTACRSRWHVAAMKETSSNPVCYAGETRNSSLFAAAKKVPTTVKTSETQRMKMEPSA